MADGNGLLKGGDAGGCDPAVLRGGHPGDADGADIFPPTMSGRPPLIGRIPRDFKARRPSPPAATLS